MGWIIAIGIIVVLAFIYFSMYNGLVKYRNWVDEAWAQIDVQLKRRYDLIPNLVETVKGYAKHEQETLAKVVELRNQLGSKTSRQEQMEVNDQLSGALKNLFALREAYPDLKANENFKMLQEELTQTENKVAYSRQLYNNTVMKYNTKVESVPTNIIASVHNFEKRDMLEAREEERENVRVSF
ncbi:MULTISPECIES: LemA family protein [Exiguobacterium]|jgi:LemA protein|uniref:LemA family protein n=1 Tax=Exiguobacterium TaxID=33986 RepID=UPI0005142D69|nr:MULTISPECIES: LemA family protein [Exiguobacterium]KGI84473.1 membrane protein [Exiguobacterium mexicanum]RHB50021.1 LemA family protein [Exiguobacterium sp. AM39-5BH]TCI70726.1 LemA family protein [Exiguobacterium sp. IPCI3]TCI79605.1 LemA family protein [Exiguobacterium sp. IPCH1]TCI82398.1 LemA family protein [Exiguobacterium sp. IPBC4]